MHNSDTWETWSHVQFALQFAGSHGLLKANSKGVDVETDDEKLTTKEKVARLEVDDILLIYTREPTHFNKDPMKKSMIPMSVSEM